MKIGIEYVAANALVELYETSKKNYVSFEDLRNYGIEIKKVLKDNNIEAVLLLSDYDLIRFAHNYSNLFTIKDENIYINDGITCEIIREKIISYMKMDLLLAMLNGKSLEALGIKMWEF